MKAKAKAQWPHGGFILGCWDRVLGGASAVAAGVALPFLDEAARAQIFDEKAVSTLERIYARAFKDATGSGERSRGAHVLALDAVHRDGMTIRDAHPVRSTLGDFLEWARNRVVPWSQGRRAP